jgi:hypothetical protein
VILSESARPCHFHTRRYFRMELPASTRFRNDVEAVGAPAPAFVRWTFNPSRGLFRRIFRHSGQRRPEATGAPQDSQFVASR